MSSGDAQLVFSTASFITSMKAFQRSAFLYRSRERAPRRPRLRRLGDDLLPGVDALVDRLLRGLVRRLRFASSARREDRRERRCRSQPRPRRLLPLTVALALALLGLVIHCAPPDSDPYRLSARSRCCAKSAKQTRKLENFYSTARRGEKQESDRGDGVFAPLRGRFRCDDIVASATVAARVCRWRSYGPESAYSLSFAAFR